MYALQYRDCVLILFFMKYVTERFGGDPNAPITVPLGSSFDDMRAVCADEDMVERLSSTITT